MFIHLNRIVLFWLLVCLSACGSDSSPPTMETLGQALFSDTNLSRDRTQSCATCHNPDHAFIDDRLDGSGETAAVSVGDDGFSIGTRNSPTASYARFAPSFVANGTRQRPTRHSTNTSYAGALGGQFLDGRETDLEGQAAQPPLNPVEMNMPDRASVVARLQENPDYITTFKIIFGDDIFDDVDAAYVAMTEAIAAFERTETFASFDSKYDRSLLALDDPNHYKLTIRESLGRTLFFSGNVNCGLCHQLHSDTDFFNRDRETFTGYEYHNIGVPAHPVLGLPIDLGLSNHPDINDSSQDGKFKVPSLRNVAVTAPYMHNGVFRELSTVVQFYNFMNNGTPTVNPETSMTWNPAEVAANIATAELSLGNAFSAAEAEAMVCFLRTLTDARYEALIEENGIDCSI